MAFYWSVGTMATVSMYSAYEAGNAANKKVKVTQEEAHRRHIMQSKMSEQQMEEQNQLATEKMTEITRAFLVAKGKAKAIEAETGTTGVSAKRIARVAGNKESEAKGQVAKEINTNIINIANGMIAKKIDTDAVVRGAQANLQNVFTNTVIGGIQGGVQGYQLGSAIKGAGASKSGTQSSQHTE